MNNKIKKQSKSSLLEKISLIAGLSNILLLGLGVALSQISRVLSVIILLAFMLSLSIGISTGIAAFTIRRAWIGLLINILMLILLGVSMFVYFTFCCAPPPRLR